MEQNIIDAFMEASKVKNCQNTRRLQQLPPPLPEKPLEPDEAVIPLPEPELLPDKTVDFLELIELRSTVREYSDQELSMKELSYLLWCTQGVKMVLPGNVTRRTVPSAGSRHAFETYLYVRRVEGLKEGIYRFLALEHALVPVKLDADIEAQVLPSFTKPNMLRASAVSFIWAAHLERMEYMFGDRSYRYLFIDAGHVCQNLYLAGHTMNIGVCAIGAFNDDEINALLGLDGRQDFVVYAAHAGKL